MHCRLLGRPGRIVALQRFLDHVQKHDRVWICRRIDIARHWKQRPPLSKAERWLSPWNNSMPPPRRGSRAACSTACTSIRPGSREAALAQRPFKSLRAAQARHGAHRVAKRARDAQLALIRAHPELAGKAMVSKTLTAESTHEQSKAGLTDCTPEEFAKIQKLNADYNAKFGFPFILAVRGPRGTGLRKQEIIDTFERRLDNPPDFELAECLRNIHRIVELRLNDKFGIEPALGNLRVGLAGSRWRSSAIPGYKEKGQLTVTYLTDAHRACGGADRQNMRDSGFDEVAIDAVGNVVGRYQGRASRARRRCSPDRHYDTVRNGGKYDGRLGIFVPMACVRELSRQGERLPFDLEVVGFAEEEGQRYKATFLGSGALIGGFDPRLAGPEGRRRRHACARPCSTPACRPRWRPSPRCARDPADYLGFVEVHIEQGPVLERAGPAAGHRHLDQWRRALSVRGRRHGQPRRHHADGPAPRRRRGRGRAGAVSSSSARRATAIRSAPSAC